MRTKLKEHLCLLTKSREKNPFSFPVTSYLLNTAKKSFLDTVRTLDLEVSSSSTFFLFRTFCAHTRRPSAPPATAADVIRLTIFLLSSSSAATNNSLLFFFLCVCVHVWPRKRMGSRRTARVTPRNDLLLLPPLHRVCLHPPLPPPENKRVFVSFFPPFPSGGV